MQAWSSLFQPTIFQVFCVLNWLVLVDQGAGALSHAFKLDVATPAAQRQDLRKRYPLPNGDHARQRSMQIEIASFAESMLKSPKAGLHAAITSVGGPITLSSAASSSSSSSVFTFDVAEQKQQEQRGQRQAPKSLLVEEDMAAAAASAASATDDLSSLHHGDMSAIIPNLARLQVSFSSPPDHVAGKFDHPVQHF